MEYLIVIALASIGHPLWKSQTYYNLAQSYHGKGESKYHWPLPCGTIQGKTKGHKLVLPYVGLR